ncbi:MAG: RIO1 family regulatory kinase/ATPase [Pyrobaculum sp.]
MIKSVVEAYHRLNKRDLRILRIIEAGHRRHEFVPEELILRWARYRREEVLDSIKRLHYHGFLRRNVTPYRGWKITALGYDVLALHTLRIQRKILRLSPTPIGVGKDSVVYAGETPSGFKIAVKFHRGGVSVFRYEELFKSKIAKFSHLEDVYSTRLSAVAEFFALSKIFESGGLVPEPIAHNRHVVVMSYIEGIELYKLTDGDFKKIAEDVLHTINVALNLGIIHGDLSPYNIIVGKKSYVIDWPQWVPTSHPEARRYLQRDLASISAFFRKWGVEIPLEKTLDIRYVDSAGAFFKEINKMSFL